MVAASTNDPQVFCETELVQAVGVWHIGEQGIPVLADLCLMQTASDCSRTAENSGLELCILKRVIESSSVEVTSDSTDVDVARLATATGTELSALVAIPVIKNSATTGIVILGLGMGYGGVESWHRDSRDELAVGQSYYSGLPSFEFMNSYVRFPKGGGIPGQIWKSGIPQLVTSPGECESFVRTFDNDPAELATAIGLPIGYKAGFAESVLLLLSSRQIPFAQTLELWRCDTEWDADSNEVTSCQVCNLSSSGAPTDAGFLTADDWRNRAADACSAHGRPQIISKQQDLLPADINVALTIPVHRGPHLIGIAALLF